MIVRTTDGRTYATPEEIGKAVREQKAELEARGVAFKELYESPPWKLHFAPLIEKHTAALRAMLSELIPHDVSNYYRGQIAALDYVLELPAAVARRLEEQRAVDDKATSVEERLQ